MPPSGDYKLIVSYHNKHIMLSNYKLVVSFIYKLIVLYKCRLLRRTITMSFIHNVLHGISSANPIPKTARIMAHSCTLLQGG